MWLVFLTMIGIDTYSWLKILRLRDAGWKEILTEILDEGNFFITYDVKNELNHYFPEEASYFQKVATLPRLNKKFDDYLTSGFDPADSSLLEYMEIKKYSIITEDYPLIDQGITQKGNIIQLADFFGSLATQGVLTHRELYHLVKFLRRMKNITKRKEKELLQLREKSK